MNSTLKADDPNRGLLTGMADILFVPMLFYVFTQWEKINTVPARILWFALLVLIKNELLSVKESYRFYGLALYILDFLSLSMYLFSIQALTRNIDPFGYDPHFWYYLSAIWFLYAAWDIVMCRKVSDHEYKGKLKLWAVYMLVASAMTVLSASLLKHVGHDLTTTSNTAIFYIAQIVPGGFILYAVVCWIVALRDKFTSVQVGADVK